MSARDRSHAEQARAEFKRRVERWKRDPTAFIREVLVDPETSAPFILYPAQEVFLRELLTPDVDGRLRCGDGKRVAVAAPGGFAGAESLARVDHQSEQHRVFRRRFSSASGSTAAGLKQFAQDAKKLLTLLCAFPRPGRQRAGLTAGASRPVACHRFL
jgi:hypothetical protein